MAQGLQTIAGVANQTKQLFFKLGYSNSTQNLIKYTYKSSIHTKCKGICKFQLLKQEDLALTS